MSIKNWNAGIIRPVPVAPTGPYQTSAAPGVWTLDQVAYWRQQGQWPTQGNYLGWVATISATTFGGLHQQLTVSSDKLYIGTAGSSSGNQPGALLRLTPNTPSIDYSTWYIRSGGALPDRVGTVYVTGGSVYGNFVAGNSFPYFLQYNASTGALTTQLLGSGYNNNTNPGPITVDSSGNFFTSFYADNVGVGRYSLSITKFNSSLSAQWGFTFVNSTNYPKSTYGSNTSSVAVTDSSGSIYVGGGLSGTGDANAGGQGGVIKLDSSGNTQWVRGYGQAGAGSTQTTRVSAIAFNGSGNLLVVTALSDSTTGVFVFEVNPSTGAYASTKKVVTFSTNAGNYGDAIATFDSSGNLYIGMFNSSTTVWIAKVDAALTSVTAVKLTRSTSGSFSVRSLSTDGTNLYFSTTNAASTGTVYFKIPATLTPTIGASATLSGTVYSFSAATGTISTTTFSNNPSLTLTKAAGMSSWSSGGLTSDPRSPVVTSAGF